MSRPSAPALCLAASGLLLGVLGVSIPWTPAMAPSGDGAMIVTQAPARGRAGPPSASPAPWDRYPPGSRIVLVDPTGHSPRVRVLSGSLPAAGAPDVSPEADAVVFTGLPRNEAGWHIYEADLSGHRLLRITRSGRDCTDPAYLAGGRIVASCANGPPEPARTAPATWSLHVIERATGDMRRITFGPGSALDPTPLRDGRILFSLQQGPGTGRPAGGIALFTVNPDGSQLEPFAGSHAAPGYLLRSRQTFDAAVLAVVSRPGGSITDIARIEMRRPLGPPRLIPLVASGQAGEGSEPLLARAVEPLPGSGLLIAARPVVASGSARPAWSIYRRGPEGGAVERVFYTATYDELEAVPVIRTDSPKGRPSSLHRGMKRATIICYDAGRSDGLIGPPGRDRPATVLVQTIAQEARAGATRVVDVGRAPVEKDGSFFLSVPADVPLRVRTRAADGRSIATSDWFWLRPGEVRACFGCHEDRESAPINRPIAAIRHDPVLPGTGTTEAAE